MDVITLLRCIRTNDKRAHALKVPAGIPINAFAAALQQNDTITQLVLSDLDNLDLGEFCLILEASSNINSLKYLDLSRMALDDDFLPHVSEFVHHCHSLVRLDLSENYFSIDAAWELGEALRHHPSMRNLVLEQVGLGNEGLRAFLEALSPGYCHLNRIDFSYNGITNVMAEYLSEFVDLNEHLLSLKLNGNFVPNEYLKQIKEKMETNALALSQRVEAAKNVQMHSSLHFLSSV